MSVFINQGLAEIILDTQIDLSSASVTTIKYRRPDGVRGTFPGTVDGTTIKYQCTNTDLNPSGIWKFQAFVTIGGLNAPGEIVTQEIKNII